MRGLASTSLVAFLVLLLCVPQPGNAGSAPPLAGPGASDTPPGGPLVAKPLPGPQANGPEGQPAPAAPTAQARARLLGLPDVPDEAGFFFAFLAQLEAQGTYPPGTVGRLERQQRQYDAAVAGGRSPPLQIYSDTYPFCDINHDGRDELVQNSYNFATQHPLMRVLDGKTGKSLSVLTGGYYYPLFDNGASNNLYDRPGEPDPERQVRAKDFAPLPDLNHDGVCDLVSFSWATNYAYSVARGVNGAITAYSGKGLAQIWTQGFQALLFRTRDPLSLCDVQVVQGFPTGFFVYQGASGPMVLTKTTDLHWTACQDPTHVTELVTGPDNYVECRVRATSDHVQLRSGATGAVVWTHDINLTADAKRMNLTWIAGVASLGGSADPDILLDQEWVTDPRCNEMDSPLDGSPLTRNGRGVDLLAIDGSPAGGGRLLWDAVIWDDGIARAKPPQTEDSFEELAWSLSQVLPDMTGDGIVDPMVEVLTQEGAESTTINSQYRTHFVPVDGVSGRLLWGTDVRFQGWGVAASLRSGPQGILALGTLDVPTDPPPQSRFPPKDVRISALRASDGTPIWSYKESFSQDSYIAYDLALQQYRDAFAPSDVDGDGILDPITPSQFTAPDDGGQVLLASATQTFQVLDGATGVPGQRMVSYGSNGLLIPCGGAGPEVTIVGGYGQHLEMARFDARTGSRLWQVPLYIDAAPVSATAGVDLTFLGGHCRDNADGRTMLGLDLGLFSQARQHEIVPIFGYPHGPDDQPAAAHTGPKLAIDTDGATPLWLVPQSPISKDTAARLAALLAPPAKQTLLETVGWNLGPAVPALLLGVSAGALYNRRLPAQPRRKAKLPDLYKED